MPLFQLAATAALWIVVAVTGCRAYSQSTAATTFDARVAWGFGLIALATAVGLGLSFLLRRRRGSRFTALGADRLGLVLLVAALAASALSHVPGQTSVKVLREEIPPLFGWLYPTAALLTPLLLSRTARMRSAADQILLTVLGLGALSGAVLLLDGPTFLCLGLVALLQQLVTSGGRVPDGLLLRLGGAFTALLLAATLLAPNPLTATPAAAWGLGAAALGLAVASRPRDEAAWRRLLAAPVLAALLIAVCGALLTAWLSLEVGPGPALRTRLTLFRQHPNFLAPFFAVHALLAVGLGLGTRRALARFGWLAGAALLAASTVMTDSRAGMAALVLGALAIPGLLGLARLARRMSLRWLAAGVLGVALLGAAGLVLAGPADLMDALSSRLERFQASVDYRADAWRNSLHIIREHPALGIGPGTFVSVERFQPGSRFFNEPTSPHPHNVLLYVAQAAGLPALAIVLAWLAVLALALWRRVRGATGPARPVLAASLLAALMALLAANLLDLGLALDTVVPAPVFLLTGLVLAGGPRRPGAVRPAGALAWTLAVLLLLVPLGLGPVAARADLQRAELLAYMAGQDHHDKALMDEARDALRRAIDRDPDLYEAYDLLSRWTESEPGGFPQAHQVLLDLVARAPHYGPSRSLLGQLYLRQQMWDQAAEALQESLADSHGSVFLTRDRADAIECLARLGRRDEAMDLLVEALRLDATVIHALDWRQDPETGALLLPVGGDTPQPPIDLVDAVERLFQRHVAEYRAGQTVGRRFWMDTYNAFRKAGRDDRALAVLDFLEAEQLLDEPHTLAAERGYIAEDAGDLEQAAEYFQQAYDLSGYPFFMTQLQRVRGELGPDDDTETAAAEALESSGEILDRPTAFRDNLDSRAAAAERTGHSAEAGRLLRSSLLYEDDLLARADRLVRAGDLLLAGHASDEALDTYTRALRHLSAKPFPLAALQTGYDASLPGHVARQMLAAWSDLGLDATARQQRAWALPAYFSWRLGPALFRLGFLAENGQVDALLREADLELMEDPNDLLARWARVDALEGLGRLREVAPEMREVAEIFSDRVERLYAQLVAGMPERLEDAEAWRELAIVNVLRGRYSEAADMFETARDNLEDAPHEDAHLLGWRARALMLAGRADWSDRARDLLRQACDEAPRCGLLRRRLESLP